MSDIGVSPAQLIENARHLRMACATARRLTRDVEHATVPVTGSVELARALGAHAQSWGWTLEHVDDQLRATGDQLEAAGRTYDWVEQCVSRATGRALP